jgi:hypothetical protein
MFSAILVIAHDGSERIRYLAGCDDPADLARGGVMSEPA